MLTVSFCGSNGCAGPVVVGPLIVYFVLSTSSSFMLERLHIDCTSARRSWGIHDSEFFASMQLLKPYSPERGGVHLNTTTRGDVLKLQVLAQACHSCTLLVADKHFPLHYALPMQEQSRLVHFFYFCLLQPAFG